MFESYQLPEYNLKLKDPFSWRAEIFKNKEIQFLITYFYKDFISIFKDVGSQKDHLPESLGYAGEFCVTILEFERYIETLGFDKELVSQEEIRKCFYQSIQDKQIRSGLENCPLLLLDEFIESIVRISVVYGNNYIVRQFGFNLKGKSENSALE